MIFPTLSRAPAYLQRQGNNSVRFQKKHAGVKGTPIAGWSVTENGTPAVQYSSIPVANVDIFVKIPIRINVE